MWKKGYEDSFINFPWVTSLNPRINLAKGQKRRDTKDQIRINTDTRTSLTILMLVMLHEWWSTHSLVFSIDVFSYFAIKHKSESMLWNNTTNEYFYGNLSNKCVWCRHTKQSFLLIHLIWLIYQWLQILKFNLKALMVADIY